MSASETLDKQPFLNTLKQLKDKYERHLSDGSVREALTRATLIDPLLVSLGWNISDPTQCIVEDWVQTSEGPDWADYSLLNPDGTTRIIWEAKRADHAFALRNIDHPEGVWARIGLF
jgi:predicted type IV restriction endonuclease